MEETKKEYSQDVTSAENKVIGIIINKPSHLTELERLLSEEMFSIESHKIIYRRMSKLFDNASMPDLDMLTSSLSAAGLLEDAGGVILAKIKALLAKKKELEERRITIKVNPDGILRDVDKRQKEMDRQLKVLEEDYEKTQKQ